MDIETARNVIRVAFRSSSELQELLGQLKQRCSSDEYQDYARGVAAAVDAIGVGLIDKATAAYPQLHAEIETSLAKYGRFI